MDNSGSPSPVTHIAASDDGCPPMDFRTRYKGMMLMYAPLDVVSQYLNRHENWFHRCARPMQTKPFTENGYILTVGRFGNFGYEIEPKIAVILDPPVEHNYLMRNVPIPDEPTLNYAIDYQANMQLAETTWQTADHNAPKAAKLFGDRPLPTAITQVNWRLDLQVSVKFPPFIYKIPHNILQVTGNRLLSSIVSQVSPRLMGKVQQNFHQNCHLPKPPRSASVCTFIPPTQATEPIASPPSDKINQNEHHLVEG